MSFWGFLQFLWVLHSLILRVNLLGHRRLLERLKCVLTVFHLECQATDCLEMDL